MSNNRHMHAFTLIELMVAMAIAGVLLSMALPAFNGFLEQRAMTTRVNELVLAMSYARSEAAKLGGLVSVQAVDPSNSDDEWGPGYCVTIGNPGNCNNPLRMFGGMDDMTLNAQGAFNDETVLSFNARGLLTLDAAGTFQLCSTDATVNPGRTIALNRIGRTTSTTLVCP